jgi:hypothetical protein
MTKENRLLPKTRMAQLLLFFANIEIRGSFMDTAQHWSTQDKSHVFLLATALIRLGFLAVMGSVVIVALCAVSWAQGLQETGTPEVDPVIAELIETHNQERAQAGLAPLQINPRLMGAAQMHARNMAARSELTHKGGNDSTPAQRVAWQGYSSLKVAENIASGQPTPQAVMQTWLESAEHRRNILGNFSDVGVARAFGEDQVPYWCVVFALPIPASGPA